MAKLLARLLATAGLWVRIQTSLKSTKWATSAKEWSTHSSPPKKYLKNFVLQILGNVPCLQNRNQRDVTQVWYTTIIMT
jgi:hypothetical protein